MPLLLSIVRQIENEAPGLTPYQNRVSARKFIPIGNSDRIPYDHGNVNLELV